MSASEIRFTADGPLGKDYGSSRFGVVALKGNRTLDSFFQNASPSSTISDGQKLYWIPVDAYDKVFACRVAQPKPGIVLTVDIKKVPNPTNADACEGVSGVSGVQIKSGVVGREVESGVPCPFRVSLSHCQFATDPVYYPTGQRRLCVGIVATIR